MTASMVVRLPLLKSMKKAAACRKQGEGWFGLRVLPRLIFEAYDMTCLVIVFRHIHLRLGQVGAHLMTQLQESFDDFGLESVAYRKLDRDQSRPCAHAELELFGK